MLKVDNTLLDTVRQAYALEEIVDFTPIVSFGDTIRWLVSLSSGKKFFLKEKVFYLRSTEFIHKIHLHEYISNRKGPVVALKKTINKRSYFNFEKKYFELQYWIEGRSLNFDNKDLYVFGRVLGIFHECGHYFNSNSYNTAKNFWITPKARALFFPDHPALICEYINILDKLCTNMGLPINLIKEIKNHIQEMIGKISWDKLPLAWLHGDASPFNALLSNSNKEILLIDLDNARKGYRIWDLLRGAVAAGAFDFTSQIVKDVRNSWNDSLMESIFTGYSEVSRITPIEWKNLKPCLGVMLVLAFISEFDLDDEIYGICSKTNLHQNIQNVKILLDKLEKIPLVN